MRLQFRKKTDRSVVSRLKKKVRIRKTVLGTAERPRLCVFRSNQHIYAQLIDDAAGKTLLSVSSLKGETKGGKNQAKEVGLAVAKAALDKEIKNVVFDRNGYLYHGRVQTLAEAAREGGLNF